MMYFPVILFALLQILVPQEVSARICYKCDGNDCATDPANKVECGDGDYCGLIITTVFELSSPFTPGINQRFCQEMSPDDPQVSGCHVLGGSGSDMMELCQCNEDLCNANEPECSKRSFRSRRLQESLAEKCKDEIQKYNLENVENEESRPFYD